MIGAGAALVHPAAGIPPLLRKGSFLSLGAGTRRPHRADDVTVARADGQTVGVDHVEFELRPSFDRPVFVCAFAGWNDGGEAATTAASYLRDRWAAQRFARIDPEDFYDFQAVRPTVQLVDGITRRVDWPANDLYHARPSGRDVVVLIGVEPSMRWRTFTTAITGVAAELDVRMLVTLGAFLADVPHTMPAPVTGSAGDPALSARLGLATSRYEGPTGIVGVLHDAAGRAGLPSASLWAAVPHYLPGGPNPKAALSLLKRLQLLLEVEIETDTISRAAEAWEVRVAEAIAGNAELSAYVHRLEEAARRPEDDLGEIPSGEMLADELERFLREQRGEHGG